MTHTDQSRAEFEAWYSEYHNDACDNYGGIDCTNPKGVAEDAWQAALNYAITSNPAETASAEAGLRDCGTLPEQSSGVELPEPGLYSFDEQASIVTGDERKFTRTTYTKFKPDKPHTRWYTEQQVRALLAAKAVPQGWIAVGERLPEPGKPVLLDIGRKHPIRAMWAARLTLEAGDDEPDWGEYDEDGDMYYCPQGWYEWNEHEDTHWRVHADPIRWSELPQPPKEQT